MYKPPACDDWPYSEPALLLSDSVLPLKIGPGGSSADISYSIDPVGGPIYISEEGSSVVICLHATVVEGWW